MVSRGVGGGGGGGGGGVLPAVEANLVMVFCDYVLFGAMALCVYPFTGRYPARVWPRHAVPYGCVWLGAMILLYVCFDLITPVYGNIVQSTRGVISIVMGYFVARSGARALEERLPRAVFWQRLGAGTLMFAAIVLFNLG